MNKTHHYTYKHTLAADDPNLAFPQSRRARVIRAAQRIATLAHADESRDKIDPDIGYISHPIMAYDLLVKLGEKDPVLLASAFLHDVLENPLYRDDPERLQRELEIELEKEGIAPLEAQQYADDIYQLVAEVTNPKHMPKLKELYQIDRVDKMSLRGKKLKIVDQAASLICNLTMANNPEAFSYQQERGFMEKAETLVTKIIQSVQHIPEEREALKPYDDFFARVLGAANRLFLHPSAAQEDIAHRRNEVREAFNFDTMFSRQHRHSILPRNEAFKPAEKYFLYDPETLPKIFTLGKPLGLIRVDFDDKGRIIKMFMHASPDTNKADEVDKMQKSFIRVIREKLRWAGSYGDARQDLLRQGTLRPGDLAIDDAFRVYYLTPPMDVDIFAAAAREAGVCDFRAWNNIKEIGQRLKDASPGANVTRA